MSFSVAYPSDGDAQLPTADPTNVSTYVQGPSTFDTPNGRVFNPQYRPLQQQSTNVTVRIFVCVCMCVCAYVWMRGGGGGGVLWGKGGIP